MTAPHWTICLLAGGKSRRMGRDKSTIAINGRTLLQHVRTNAIPLGLPIKTIRTDVIPKCGPLSGVYTGLKRSRPGWCLVLTCDMPLVSEQTLRSIIREAKRGNAPVAVCSEHGWGFPLAVSTEAAAAVLHLMEAGERSFQKLIGALNAIPFTLPPRRIHELLNVNTPDDLKSLVVRWTG